MIFNNEELYYLSKIACNESSRTICYIYMLSKVSNIRYLQYNNHDQYISCEHLTELSKLATHKISYYLNDKSEIDNSDSFFIVKSEPYINKNNLLAYVGFTLILQSASHLRQDQNSINSYYAIIQSIYVVLYNDVIANIQNDIDINLSEHTKKQFPNKTIVPFILYYIKYAILKRNPYSNNSFASGGYYLIPEDNSTYIIAAYDYFVNNDNTKSIYITDLAMPNIIFL